MFRRRVVGLLLSAILALPVLAGCVGSSSGDATIAWTTVEPTIPPTNALDAAPEGLGGATGPLPTTAADLATPDAPAATLLSPQELVRYQPNELGMVPILEYHVITTNPAEEAQFVRTADDFRADLEWLYANDFYVVPLSDVVNNTISAPAGKHPVALTFDDGTSSHFSYLEDKKGEIVLDEHGEPVIDPDCAVGILEAFYAEHPDFGGGAHFAPLIYNAFAYPDTEQDDLFDQKVLWMVEHGYEIGNHTWQHTDLTDISDEEFMMTVAKPQIYMNELLGDHPGNASHILTLPYGSSPDRDLHPAQRQMMMDGFAYEGHQIDISGALLVGADPAPSPASTEWHKLWIPRIQMFDESVDFWFGMIERGEIIVYTSDGNPETIAVPDPQHPALDGTLNQEALQADGVSVLHYRVDDGQIVAHGAIIESALVPPIRTGGHAMRGVTYTL